MISDLTFWGDKENGDTVLVAAHYSNSQRQVCLPLAVVSTILYSILNISFTILCQTSNMAPRALNMNQAFCYCLVVKWLCYLPHITITRSTHGERGGLDYITGQHPNHRVVIRDYKLSDNNDGLIYDNYLSACLVASSFTTRLNSIPRMSG